MIKRIDNLPECFSDSLCYSRIKAYYNTYNKTLGAEMYVQLGDDEITAFLGRTGAGFSLCANKNADFGELCDFFSFLSTEVFCEEWVKELLDAKSAKTVSVYEFCGDAQDFIGRNGKISEVYNALSFGTDGAIELPTFEEFYPDLCARVNHNSAEYYVTDNAAAVIGFMTDKFSMITGVATKKDERAKGEGRKALLSVCSKALEKYPNTKIVAAAEDAAAAFYKKCGFSHFKNYAILNF